MLYSIGKDSAVMLHLAIKAFYPSPPPFPLLHVDTTWKFRDMYALRDDMAREPGIELIVHQQPRGGGARASTRSTTARCTPTCGRPRAEAGARQVRLRRRLRRRAARRGEEPRQGAHLLLPHAQPPLGPEEPTAGAVAALQRPQEQGREHPRVPAVELDRARRLAIHPCARGFRSCRSISRPSARRSSATALS